MIRRACRAAAAAGKTAAALAYRAAMVDKAAAVADSFVAAGMVEVVDRAAVEALVGAAAVAALLPLDSPTE